MKNKILYILALGGFLFSSCSKDFLNIEPESSVSKEQLGESSSGTLASLLGVYGALRSYGITDYAGHEDYGHKAVLTSLSLMGNDVVMNELNWHGFNYNYNVINPSNSRIHQYWLTYYLRLKDVNALINSISDSEAGDLKYYKGQALALRGYFHFMLARIYGPTYVGNTSAKSIPLSAETLSSTRNTVQEVYAQIEKDLQKAITFLEGYKRESKEFVDKQVAQAFLADVYLEMGKYAEAAQLAKEARQGYTLLSKADYLNGFYQIDQNETMWGADINGETNTWRANFFSHFDNTNSGYARKGNIAIDKRLYDAISATDYRKELFSAPGGTLFNGKNYAQYLNLKFRDLTPKRTDGDYIYLRSSSLYYIEAEALARSGNEVQAQSVLFEITKERDASYVQSTNTGQALIDEILTQKRIELWGEGYEWFDLKRLNKGVERDYTDSNHGTFGKLNIPANDKRFIFPIPQKEVDANPDILN